MRESPSTRAQCWHHHGMNQWMSAKTESLHGYSSGEQVCSGKQQGADLQPKYTGNALK